MTAHIRKLVDHLAWADAATLRSLRDAPNAGGRTLQLYAHIVAAESVWLARIAGRSPDVAVWPALSLDDAAALAERNARELDGLAGTLGAGDLDRAIVYRNSAGREFRSTLGDILLHISLHGTYHRG
ncbi:MAG TPA: DinB family protein, partial [Gemmatimonadaceae bacterium]|nr:DinB family protein [Gemmatimonadaceae bacterium]